MQKHTPGPWTVTEVGPATRYMIAGAATSVAMTYGQSGQEADARLIAAAPELLAALLDVIGLAERGAKAGNDPEMTDLWMRGHIANARTVIAKVIA